MNVYIYILIMASVTYLIRFIPLALMKKKIENRYVKSFLYYVPYACLSAMTFPSVFFATENPISAAVGVAAAFVPAFMNKSLLTVAATACAAVFAAEKILLLF